MKRDFQLQFNSKFNFTEFQLRKDTNTCTQNTPGMGGIKLSLKYV